MTEDMQFAEAEELRQNEADDAEMADMDGFMAEEAEHDAYVDALRESLDRDEGLEGVATAEEVEEIASYYGLKI